MQYWVIMNDSTSHRPKHFAEGDAVYTRNYRQGSSWLPDVVMEQEGCVLIRVRLADGRVIRRHKVQLKHRECRCQRGTQSGTVEQDKLVHGPLSTIRGLSFIGEFLSKSLICVLNYTYQITMVSLGAAVATMCPWIYGYIMFFILSYRQQ